MMEKIDHIQYGKTTATKDWKRVNLLLKNRDYEGNPLRIVCQWQAAYMERH